MHPRSLTPFMSALCACLLGGCFETEAATANSEEVSAKQAETPEQLEAFFEEAATAAKARKVEESVFANTAPPERGELEDQPLAEYRTRLLQIAIDAVTAMPVNPHLKDRSRSQEEVVKACFELEQPRLALAYVEKIDNWRRGAGYADYAYYCAEHGDPTEVAHYLDLARRISEGELFELLQEWRADYIRARIAQAQFLIGNAEEAARLEGRLEDPTEAGKLAVARIETAEKGSFDEHFEAMGDLYRKGGFEHIGPAMQGDIELYDRFYEDEGLRDKMVERILSFEGQVPRMVSIQVRFELAEAAVAHGDSETALAWAAEAEQRINETEWVLDDEIPLLARLATILHSAGDEEKAMRVADSAMAVFNAKWKTVHSIWRGKALRPLAEAYLAMDSPGSAKFTYYTAVEEGARNPNARPRAMDLAATCVSMAVNEFEPDAALWERLEQIRDGLQDPW